MDNPQKTLTVFTPTYNRSYCLPRCYEGMKAQTSRDFIWMIIDDGSTDGTGELVGGWQAQGLVEIVYIYQQNQGMHGAHNTAYEHIKTTLNTCIDSDDYMPPNAVEKIVDFWRRHGEDQYSGIAALDCDADGRVIGTQLPDNVKSSRYFDLYHKHRVRGDKKLIYRSELTRKYPYPVFEGEKYVGLACKYARIDIDYEMLIMNQPVCFVEYMPDGSSRNMMKQYINNPKGFAFIRREDMALPFGSFSHKFRQAVHYVSSSIFAKDAAFLTNSPKKLITLLATPFGVLLNIYIRLKARQERIPSPPGHSCM